MMVSARDPRGGQSAIEQQIAAARQGSAPALGELLDAFRNYLLLIANAELDGELRKKFGASDLVQETCVHAQKGFAGFQGTTEAELCAWLRQILINRCRNLRLAYRQTDKRDIARELPLTGTSSIVGPIDELATGDASPSRQAMAEEEALLVARAMASLPKDYQEVIRLRHWEDLSFDEIGARMGRSSEAVRKLWSRAIASLGVDWESDDRDTEIKRPQ